MSAPPRIPSLDELDEAAGLETRAPLAEPAAASPETSARRVLTEGASMEASAFNRIAREMPDAPPLAPTLNPELGQPDAVGDAVSTLESRPRLMQSLLEDPSHAYALNPHHWDGMREAVDDFDPFSIFDRVERTTGAAGDQFSANIDLIESGYRGSAEMSDALFGTHLGSRTNQARISALQQRMAEKQSTIEGLSVPEQAVAVGFGMIPFSAMALTARGVGSATRAIPKIGPAVAPVARVAVPMTAVGMVEGGAFFNSVRAQRPDLDPQDVATAGVIVGALNGALELLPIESAAANLTPALRREATKLLADRQFTDLALHGMKRLMIQSGSEGFTEFLQEIGPVAGELALQYANGEITAEEAIRGMTSPEAMVRYGESAYLGFIGAPVIGGISVGGGMVLESTQIARAQERREAFEQIANTSVANQEIIDSVPQRYRQMIDDATGEDGQVEGVFIHPDQLDAAYGEGTQERAQLLNSIQGLGDRIALARATGGKVRFSPGEFATWVAPSAQFAALGDHLSFEEGQASLAEATEMANPENVAALRERLEALRDSLETDPVRDSMLEQDFAANLSTIFAETMPAVAPPVRNRSASVFARMMTRVAEMDGQEPLELFATILDRTGFEQRPELDSAAEQARTDRIFSDQEILGQTDEDVARLVEASSVIRPATNLDGEVFEGEYRVGNGASRLSAREALAVETLAGPVFHTHLTDTFVRAGRALAAGDVQGALDATIQNIEDFRADDETRDALGLDDDEFERFEGYLLNAFEEAAGVKVDTYTREIFQQAVPEARISTRRPTAKKSDEDALAPERLSVGMQAVVELGGGISEPESAAAPRESAGPRTSFSAGVAGAGDVAGQSSGGSQRTAAGTVGRGADGVLGRTGSSRRGSRVERFTQRDAPVPGEFDLQRAADRRIPFRFSLFRGAGDSSGDSRPGSAMLGRAGQYFTDNRRAAEIYAEFRENGRVEEAVVTLERPFSGDLVDQPGTMGNEERAAVRAQPEYQALFRAIEELGGIESGEAFYVRAAKSHPQGAFGAIREAILNRTPPEERETGFWPHADAVAEMIRAAGFDGIVDEMRDLPELPNHGQVLVFDAADSVETLRQPTRAEGAQRTRGQLVLDRALQRFMIQISEAEVNDSTLIHELAHLALEIVLDVADGPDAGAEIQQFARDALEFLGVESRDQIGREHHERWAESWELYLSKGEAPTSDLQPMFTFFFERLKVVYRAIRDQLMHADHDLEFVPLFDRLLATEDEIRHAAAHDQITSPLLNESAYELMTDAERREVEAAVRSVQASERQRLEATIARETQRELRAQVGELREEITQEVLSRPEQRLRHWLRTGKTPTGEPIRVFVAGTETKLHKLAADKVRNLGLDPRDLPRGTWTKDGGLDPALVAAATGYSTPEEMLEALEQATDPRKEITRRVHEESEQRGLVPSTEELQEMAAEQVDGPQRDRLYETERRVARALRGRLDVRAAEQRAAGGSAAPTAGQSAQRVQAARQELEAAIAAQVPQDQIAALQVELARAEAGAQVGREQRADQLAARRNAGSLDRVPTRVLRATARGVVADTTYAELKRSVRDWKRLRSRASSEQTRAVLARDFDALERAIDQEQLANALAEEGASKLDEVRAWRRFFQSYDKRTSPKRARLLKHANVEPLVEGGTPTNILDVIDGLLSMVDFRQVSQKRLQNAASILHFARQLEEDQGVQIPLPSWVHQLTEVPNYSQMTVGQLEELYTAVRALEKQGLEMAREREGDEASAFMTEVEELRDHLRDQSPTVFAEKIKFGAQQQGGARMKVADIVGSNMSVESLVDVLDNGNPEGPFNRLIWQRIDAMEHRREELKRLVADPINAAWQRYSAKERRDFATVGIKIASLGESLTKNEIMGVAAHMGNEHNRAALRDASVYGLTDTQLEEILSHLTENDRAYLIAVAEAIDLLWEPASAAEREINGVVPPKVEGTPWQLPDGTWMPGFYFPLDFSPYLQERSYEHAQREIGKGLMPAGGGQAMTKAGAMNQRKKTSGGLTVNTDFHAVLTKHVDSMTKDIAYRGTLIKINKLIRALEGDMKRVLGTPLTREFRKFIKRISTPIRVGDEAVPQWIVRVARHSRIGLGLSVMAWRFTQAAIQISGFMTAMHRLGPTYMAAGFQEVYASGNPWTQIKRYRELVPALEDRAHTFDRDAQAEAMRMASPNGRTRAGRLISQTLTNTQRFSAHYGFYMLGTIDTIAATAVAAGAIRQAMAGKVEGIDANDLDAAVRYADKIIKRTQGSGRQVDQPAVLDGGELLKLVTPMMTFANTQFQQAIVHGTLAHRELSETARGERKGVPRETARFLAFWTSAFLIEPMLSEGIRYAIQFASEPEPPDEEDYFRKLAVRFAAGPLGGVPIAREVESALLGWTAGGTPLEDLASTYWDMAYQTGLLLTFDRDFDGEKWARALAEGVTYSSGVPTKQMVDAFEVLTQESFGRGDR